MNQTAETLPSEAEPIEGSARELTRTAPAPLVQRPSASSTLWRTDDPAVVVQRATALADAIAPLIRSKRWAQNFGGERDHLQIEAWQTLGSMAGVFTVRPIDRELPWPTDDHLTDELRQIRDSGYAFGYQVEYEAVTIAGAVCGGAKGICKRTESNWCMRKGEPVDDYALLGMAQTRAQSRTFASPLRFVVELAGFSGTPAEEMQQGMANGNGGGERTGFASDSQESFFRNLLDEKGVSPDNVELVCSYAAATMSGSRGGQISNSIDGLKGKGEGPTKVAQQLVAEAQAWKAKQAGGSAPAADGPAAVDDDEPVADALPDDAVEEIVGGIRALGIGFNRLGALMGTVGAERPAINRPDSVRKALRALSPEQAQKLLAKMNAAADRSAS